MMRWLCTLLFFIFFPSLAPLTAGDGHLSDHFRKKARVMNHSGDLDHLVAGAKDKKLVLLGESSHGTHEFYTWRDSISRRLIAEHGFNFIAVEGDFAPLFELNRYVKNLPGAAGSAQEVLLDIDRWPLWMWSNEEMIGLAEWLRQYNDNLTPAQKVGFYGMDVYDEWRSKRMLLDFLEKHEPSLFEKVAREYNCLKPFRDNSWHYARMAAAGVTNCAIHTETVVQVLGEHKETLSQKEEYAYLYALQNALVVQNAEKFFRKSAAGKGTDSWNARVMHMQHTCENLLDFYGPDAKGIIWAHNTHVGDASYTGMKDYNELNIGQLARERLGRENVFLVGLTTYTGRVQAALQWEAMRQEMTVVAARKNSLEALLHRTGHKRFYLVFDEEDRKKEALAKSIGHRAIGVIYNPNMDHRQYVSTIVPLRYDALLFFARTKALTPLQD